METEETLDQAETMDLQQAASIDRDTRKRALHELRLRTPFLVLNQGLVFLLGYGVLWLSVRNQHPFQAPPAWAWLVVITLALVGGLARLVLVSHPVEGVKGRAKVQAVILGMTKAAGLVALWVEAAALDHAGASRTLVYILAFAVPPLVVGFLYLAMSASYADLTMAAAGVWLLAVAAGGAFAGPETMLAVYALGCGGGCLLAAAVQPRVQRS